MKLLANARRQGHSYAQVWAGGEMRDDITNVSEAATRARGECVDEEVDHHHKCIDELLNNAGYIALKSEI